MATQLGIYNRALLILKSSTLTAVGEANEKARTLTSLYTDVLAYMLEQGFWKFAIRTVSVTEDDDNEPEFGLSMAFNKPEDWVSTYQISGNDRFDPPLENWIEESNLWFADISPLYVRYISNDADYGGDLTRFTARYTEAVAHELAKRAQPKIAAGMNVKDLKDDCAGALSAALSFEALREPPKRPQMGRWASSRFGRGSPRRVSGGWIT
jgi:hypothetical protein